MSLCYITTFNRFLFFLKADVAYYVARLFLFTLIPLTCFEPVEGKEGKEGDFFIHAYQCDF